jgi:tripartite-type tricarboxylate transporter receptor subunit TctC
VPTIGETVAGYEANSRCGVGVPRGTPPVIVDRLNREINAGLKNPAVIEQLAKVSTTPIIFTPAEFGAFMASEVEKWGKVIKVAGVRPE